MKLLHRLLSLAVLLAGSTLAQAGAYTFTVEPSYPPEQAAEVYKPLLDYLKRSTGHDFNLNVPRNYHFYWRDLRQATKTDFVYEEPHFTDYRVARSGFEALVRRADPGIYVLMADEANAEGGVNGLVGKRIVSMAAPSMGFALLAEMFKNPIAQPEIRSEALTWKDGVEMVFSGDAEAAMVPAFIAQQYPNLIEITRSREFSGSLVSAAPEVPAEVKQAVKDALLKLAEDPAAGEILAELGGTGFATADAKDFKGTERLLSGFFGYSKP